MENSFDRITTTPDDFRQLMAGLVKMSDWDRGALLHFLRTMRPDLFVENK